VLPKRDREGGRQNGRGERLGCGGVLMPRRRGGREGGGERGSGGESLWFCRTEREREEAVGGRKGMIGGPDLSAIERGRGWGRPAGLGPEREEGGGAGFGPSRPKVREEGEERRILPSSISNQFSNTYSN